MSKARFLAAVLLPVLFAGCWTFNQTEYPATSLTPASENSSVSVALTGFEALLTEYESVHGFQTVYVPGYCGRRHYHPGYFETVPTVTYVQQRRSTDMFLRRAQDQFEKAGFTLAPAGSDCTVDLRFEGPCASQEDLMSSLAWKLCTVFFCDCDSVEWQASLRVRDSRTGRLLFHHDYVQRYEAHVVGLIPLFGPACAESTSRAFMQSWCLAALTDRAVADTTAFLSTYRK